MPKPPDQGTLIVSQWYEGRPTTFTGEVYMDGAASRPQRTSFSASTCAIVSLRDWTGHYYPLDHAIIVDLTCHTDGPEGAEISAVEHLLLNCLLPITAYSDNANVVRSYAKGRAFCTAPTHPYAHIWRRVFLKLSDHTDDPTQLTIIKVKAHISIDNIQRYNMTAAQHAGNKYADKFATERSAHLDTFYGLDVLNKSIDAIEAEHKELVKWIAKVTAIANDDATRDHDPPPEGYKKKLRAKTKRNGVDSSRPTKKRRATAPTGLKRTFGHSNATQDEPDWRSAPLSPSRKYVCLRQSDGPQPVSTDTHDDSGARSSTDMHSQPAPSPLSPESTRLRNLAFNFNGEDLTQINASTFCSICDENDCGVRSHRSAEQIRIDEETYCTTCDDNDCGVLSHILARRNDMKRRKLNDQPDSQGISVTPQPSKRIRLNEKTFDPSFAHPPSQTVHGELPQSLADDLENIMEEDEEFIENDSDVITRHGGYMLQTDNVVWCSRCGASATIGKISIYLRKPCEGRPPTDNMIVRRKRLMKGKHPTTCKLFESKARKFVLVA